MVDDQSLAELTLLPGRPPDVRVAISAAFKAPDQTGLPNGHPKFIVFRRDSLNNGLERAEVRVVAKIAREFSAEATGKKLGDSDDAWVIRNFSYPFRVSPLPDSSEMYELHSEDPALELPPGRYVLILKIRPTILEWTETSSTRGNASSGWSPRTAPFILRARNRDLFSREQRGPKSS